MICVLYFYDRRACFNSTFSFSNSCTLNSSRNEYSENQVYQSNFCGRSDIEAQPYCCYRSSFSSICLISNFKELQQQNPTEIYLLWTLWNVSDILTLSSSLPLLVMLCLLLIFFPAAFFTSRSAVSLTAVQPLLSDGLFCCLKHLIGGQVYIIRGESPRRPKLSHRWC